MSDLYRFPELTRDEPHLSLSQRLDNAYERGSADGYVQGLAEGKRAAMQELEAQLRQEYELKSQQQLSEIQQQNQQQLDNLIGSFHQRFHLEEERLGQEITELVSTISKAVLRVELSLNPELYLRGIEQVLESLPGHDHIETIQVSETDAKWLQTQQISEIGGVKVSNDETLPPGQVQFNGKEKLHLWSFQQSLDDVLTQIKPILLGEHAN